MSNNSWEEEGSQTAIADDLEMDGETSRAIGTLVDLSRETGAETERFDPGLLFELLSDPGHRYVLTYLLGSDGAVTCGELVDYVTRRTDNTMNPEVFRQRVVAELSNTYLPNLDESGYITYNMERQLVGPTELTPLARPYLLLALAHIGGVELEDEAPQSDGSR